MRVVQAPALPTGLRASLQLTNTRPPLQTTFSGSPQRLALRCRKIRRPMRHPPAWRCIRRAARISSIRSWATPRISVMPSAATW
jgi:hypothetical protein